MTGREIGKRLVQFIFFANYFVGLLVVALSVETVVQLNLPLNSPAYYVLISSATILYYTRAYRVPPGTRSASNPRTDWYGRHYRFVKNSQLLLSVICGVAALWLGINHVRGILALPLYYWALLGMVGCAALLYYGLMPRPLLKLNLRNTGWLKAFVIGFVWAGCVSLMPVAMVHVERGVSVAFPGLMLWLFVKNWMFCTVNAIMFDLKDYADDANHQLKTFVVRFGLRKTIYFILMPLLLIGLASFLAFVTWRGFGLIPILFNLLPFLCLLAVAWSLHRRKKILYYLIVIDGLLLLKALCGIAGMLFVS